MAEREILEEIAERTKLLEPRDDKHEQEQRVAKFTRISAWAVRASGWGNVKKTGGARVDNKSIDKLIHRDTGVVVDIVSKSDGPTADDPKPPRVSWTAVDTLDPKEFFVAPVNEEGDEPDVDEPPAPQPPAGDEFALLLSAVDRIVDSLTLTLLSVDNATTRLEAAVEGVTLTKLAIDELNARIDQIRSEGVKVRLR